MCQTLLFGNTYTNLNKKVCTCIANTNNTVIMKYSSIQVKYPKLMFAGVYVAVFGRNAFHLFRQYQTYSRYFNRT